MFAAARNHEIICMISTFELSSTSGILLRDRDLRVRARDLRQIQFQIAGSVRRGSPRNTGLRPALACCL